MHCVADVLKDETLARWVRTKARHVDVNNESDLIIKVANLLTQYRLKIGWSAVSSNNVYYDKISNPISMIQVPTSINKEEKEVSEYVTLVNPNLIGQKDEIFLITHFCGSIRGPSVAIPTYSRATLLGYCVEKQENVKLTLESSHLVAWAWHELFHLLGGLITDMGVVNRFNHGYFGPAEYLDKAIQEGWEKPETFIHLELRFNNEPEWHVLKGNERYSELLYGKPIRVSFPRNQKVIESLSEFGKGNRASNDFMNLPVYGLNQE